MISRNWKKAFKISLGIAFALFFLWLIFSKINLEEISKASDGISWPWICAALLIFIIGYAARIQRWRVMLLRDNPSLDWGQCAGPLLGSFALNNILPFRVGDFIRTFAFNKTLGVTSGAVLASLFVERLLDLLMVLIFLLVGLHLFKQESTGLLGIGELALLLMSLAILILLFIPKIFFPVGHYLSNLLVRIAPAIGMRIKNLLNHSFSVLSHLSGSKVMARLMLWSLIAWFSEGCVFWFAALGLPSISNSIAAWLALPVGTLATLIPSTPGYVGTFDFFVIESMRLMGNSIGGSAVFALIVHVIIWAPPTIIGGSYLLLNSVLKKTFKEKNEYLN